MPRHVGVIYGAGKLRDLKRLLLFFDSLAVVNLRDFIQKCDDPESSDFNPPLAETLRWLETRSLVFEPVEALDDATSPDPQLNYLLQLARTQNLKLEAAMSKVIEKSKMKFVDLGDGRQMGLGKEPVGLSQAMSIIGPIFELRALETRCASIQLRRLQGLEAVSLHPLSRKLELGAQGQIPPALAPRSESVIHVTIGALPLPAREVPWEKLLEFKSDPETRPRLLGLRSWISDVARADFSHIELQDRLEYLLHEYEEYMRLHDIQTNMGVVETVITVASEVVEDLLRMKWSRLARLPFAFRRRKVALLEAELHAPGREVSYVLKARKSF